MDGLRSIPSAHTASVSNSGETSRLVAWAQGPETDPNPALLLDTPKYAYTLISRGRQAPASWAGILIRHTTSACGASVTVREIGAACGLEVSRGRERRRRACVASEGRRPRGLSACSCAGGSARAGRRPFLRQPWGALAGLPGVRRPVGRSGRSWSSQTTTSTFLQRDVRRQEVDDVDHTDIGCPQCWSDRSQANSRKQSVFGKVDPYIGGNVAPNVGISCPQCGGNVGVGCAGFGLLGSRRSAGRPLAVSRCATCAGPGVGRAWRPRKLPPLREI